jgi:hypothetical protein
MFLDYDTWNGVEEIFKKSTRTVYNVVTGDEGTNSPYGFELVSKTSPWWCFFTDLMLVSSDERFGDFLRELHQDSNVVKSKQSLEEVVVCLFSNPTPVANVVLRSASA